MENTTQTPQVREKLWNSNYIKVWSSNFMLFFSFMLLTPLLPLYLNEQFGADKETIGYVLAGYTLTTLLIRPFSGYFVDSLPRKAVLLVTFGVFAAFFGGYLLAGSLVAFAIVRTLHGFPFGSVTVANSTVAIDVLPSSRRTEGIGFYGLSNNIATAIGPTIAMWIFAWCENFNVLFTLSLIIAAGGFVIDSTVKLKRREPKRVKPPVSLDRFLLLKGWSQSLCMVCYAFSFGVLTTYIAIYARDELGITGGTGFFFMLMAGGLILSRLTGTRTLRKGMIARNASIGVAVALCGYCLFAAVHSVFAFYASALIIGLGNGHMFPAFQNMFINLAENDRRGTANSTLLVSWDIGIGIGTLLGGTIAQYQGFEGAFWSAFAVNACGAVLYLAYSRRHYLRHRLR